MDNPNAFRHHPNKTRIRINEKNVNRVIDWSIEPVVSGLVRQKYYNNKEKRSFDVPVSATPAVVEGVGVIVASDDGYIRFYSMGFKKIYWERRINSSFYASPVFSSKRKYIYICSTNGDVLAISLSGVVKWHTKLEHGIYSTPAINIQDDIFIVATFDSLLFYLNLNDGKVINKIELDKPWHYGFSLNAQRYVYASVAMTRGNLTIICNSTTIYEFDEFGKIVWKKNLKDEVKSSPVVIDDLNLVVVFTVKGNCLFFDFNGNLLNDIFLAEKISGSAAYNGDILCVGGTNGSVFGISLMKRKILWLREWNIPFDYTSITFLPNGNFVAVNKNGNIVCISKESGEFVWESSQVLGLVDHNTAMHITPSISNYGYVYCGSYEGNLYEFKFKSNEKESLNVN